MVLPGLDDAGRKPVERALEDVVPADWPIASSPKAPRCCGCGSPSTPTPAPACPRPGVSIDGFLTSLRNHQQSAAFSMSGRHLRTRMHGSPYCGDPLAWRPTHCILKAAFTMQAVPCLMQGRLTPTRHASPMMSANRQSVSHSRARISRPTRSRSGKGRQRSEIRHQTQRGSRILAHHLMRCNLLAANRLGRESSLC